MADQHSVRKYVILLAVAAGLILTCLGVVGFLSQVTGALWGMLLGIVVTVVGMAFLLSGASGPISRRATISSANTIILMVVAVAAAVFVYLFSLDQDIKWDLSTTKRFTLQQASRDLLDKVGQPVRAVMLFEGGVNPEVRLAREQFEETAERFQRAFPDQFSWEVINLWENPTLLETVYTDAYSTPAFYVEIGDSASDAGIQRKKTNGATEQDLDSALNALLHKETQKVYFVTGHGELSLDEGNVRGGSILKQRLTDELFKVAPLSFGGAPEIPEDCTILAIAGPRQDYSTPECSAIRAFAARGGRLLVALTLDPTPNLDALLTGLGIQPRIDVALEGTMTADSVEEALLGNFRVQYTDEVNGVDWDRNHEIARGFNFNVPFLASRTLTSPETPAAGVMLTEIVKSVGGDIAGQPGVVKAYGETDLKTFLEQGADRSAYEPGVDTPGPLTLLAVSQIDLQSFDEGIHASTVEDAPKYGRLVCFGAVTGLQNRMFGEGRMPQVGDLVMRCLNWLGEQGAITLKTLEDQDTRIMPTKVQGRLIRYASVLLLPLLCVLLGLSVALTRSE